MNVLATLLLLVLATVCLGIPLTATAVVYRDDLVPAWRRLRLALAFDPRHPALEHPSGR